MGVGGPWSLWRSRRLARKSVTVSLPAALPPYYVRTSFFHFTLSSLFLYNLLYLLVASLLCFAFFCVVEGVAERYIIIVIRYHLSESVESFETSICPPIQFHSNFFYLFPFLFLVEGRGWGCLYSAG